MREAAKMLLLVGLGLEEGCISAKAISSLKKADKILVERYTLPITDSYLSMIEKETGKKAEEITRQDLEDNIKKTLGQGVSKTLAILVPGDPLIATTHHTIIDVAKEMEIETKIYHSSSIFTAAIGESGLDIYKFGPTTTIPFWTDKYKPTSFIGAIKKNLDNGEHTLVLLDIDAENQKTMSAGEALTILKKAEETRGSIFKKESRILILCDIGSDQQKILYTSPSQKKATEGLTGKKTSLIIPAKMNFAEEEHLKHISS